MALFLLRIVDHFRSHGTVHLDKINSPEDRPKLRACLHGGGPARLAELAVKRDLTEQ